MIRTEVGEEGESSNCLEPILKIRKRRNHGGKATFFAGQRSEFRPKLAWPKVNRGLSCTTLVTPQLLFQHGIADT